MNEDTFLPPPEPEDNPPEQPTSQSKKTIILWVLLILVFFAVYHFLSGSPGSHHRTPHPRSTLSPYYWVACGASWVIMIALLVWVRWRSRFNRALLNA